MSSIERDDKIELQGIVIESNKGVFKVQVSENHIVNCKLGGKMKINEIRVIVGDSVTVEVSPYSLVLGRISKRIKQS